MFDTIFGIVIGIFTSLVAGVILIWKQDQIAAWLKHLPDKRRIRLFTLVYVRALRTYPFGLAHAQAIVFTQAITLAMALFYCGATIAAFILPDGLTLLKPINEMVSTNSKAVAFWLLVSLRVITPLVTLWILWDLPTSLRRLFAEIAVPYAHRELERVRQCVLRVGSPKDFVAYTHAEHAVRSADQLIELMKMAKRLLKDYELQIVDEIIEAVSPKVGTTSAERSN